MQCPNPHVLSQHCLLALSSELDVKLLLYNCKMPVLGFHKVVHIFANPLDEIVQCNAKISMVCIMQVNGVLYSLGRNGCVKQSGGTAWRYVGAD